MIDVRDNAEISHVRNINVWTTVLTQNTTPNELAEDADRSTVVYACASSSFEA